MAERNRAQATATSDSSGAATFTLPPPPQGTVYTGSLAIPSAPSAALAIVTIGGIAWGGWGGNATFGPVQQWPTESISIAVTGLTASTLYTAVFVGMAQREQDAAIVWPSAGSTATASVTVTGSQGAMQLISRQLLTTIAASVTFAGIPQTYDHLQLEMVVRSNKAAATNDNMLLRLNGDAGANYYWGQWQFGGSGVTSQQSVPADTAIQLPEIPATTAPAGTASSLSLFIPGYTGTTFHKQLTVPFGIRTANAAANQIICLVEGTWASTAAITDLVLSLTGGSYIAGCLFSLYGLTNA